jgi:uncharacterized RDD family membrane protein YckC
MPASLNFRAVMPILGVMNAIAQVSAAPVSGSKLDNRRVMAAIVDLLIVTAGAVVVLVAGDSLSGDRQGALAAVILGWALYYFFALESGEGQTVGKKLMKLRVVRADGRPAGMREIAVRTILRVVDGIGLYIVGLIVMLITGERRQRIGDLAAATIVVDASGPATLAPPAAPDAVTDEADAEEHEDDEPADEPVAVAEPTRTITLPSRATPPATLSDLTEPAAEEVADEVAEEAEPAAGAEPAAEEVAEDTDPVAESEPVVEVDPVVEDAAADAEPVTDEPAPEAESFEVEPFEVKPFHVEPMELESVTPDVHDGPAEEPAEVAEEPAEVAEEPTEVAPAADVADDPLADAVPVPERPVAEEPLPAVTSKLLEELAADVAAAQGGPAEEAAADEASVEDAPVEDAPVEDAPVEDAPADDEPVNVKSVETVSAMDLIMGAAEQDAAQFDEDEGPASA